MSWKSDKQTNKKTIIKTCKEFLGLVLNLKEKAYIQYASASKNSSN